LLASLFPGLYPETASPDNIYSTSVKGMDIEIIQDPLLGYIHAELIIFYRNKAINPAIPYLTLFNIFDRDLLPEESGLLADLAKLGNTYTVCHRPDYLVLKIDFLPERLGTFLQFLKEVFSYKSFSLKRFNDSVQNYRTYFKKKEHWAKLAARQVVYSSFFPGHLLGNTLISPPSIQKINLAEIRSFYQETYTPANSLLIMRGNMEPAVAAGGITRTLLAFKNHARQEPPREKLPAGNRDEIVIYHVDNATGLEIFWFLAIPPLSHEDHLAARVMNDAFFGHHIGFLSHLLLAHGIRTSKIETEVFNHREVSVICNALKLDYNDLERFLVLSDQEMRKLKTSGISRKDYLNAKNYFYGQLKVKSARVEMEVEEARDHFLFGYKSGRGYTSIPPSLYQEVTLENLNRVTGEQVRSMIVIVGNADIIMKNITTLKPVVIKLF